MEYEQLSFLSVSETKSGGKSHTVWKVYVDGAARNNPGPAGAGICIYKNGVIALQERAYLGIRTNNQAEYCALLCGLQLVKPLVQLHDRVHIISDSQLLVRQILGSYRVKDVVLKKLHQRVSSLLNGLSFDVMHVNREENSCADSLANEAIDQKAPIPKTCVELLSGL